MKKTSWLFVLALLFSVVTFAEANDGKKEKRPPRPEKIVEEIPQAPSLYHVWEEGRWRWKKKQKAWIWKEGYWRMPDPYEYRYNRLAYGPYFSPYRYRLARYYFRPFGFRYFVF